MSVNDTLLQQLGPYSGFQAGDQILSVNGMPVTTPQAFFQQLLNGSSANGMAKVEVSRIGSTVSVQVDPWALGFGFQFAPGTAARIGAVNADSLAAQLGLRAGDQILSVNGDRIASASALRSELSNLLGSKQPATVRVQRTDGSVATVRLPLSGTGTSSGTAGNASLGSLANQTAGTLKGLGAQLGPVLQQLGPAGQSVASQLQQLVTNISGLATADPQSALKTIASTRQSLRSLRSDLDRLISQSDASLQPQLEQLRSSLLGMQTNLDSLSTAARRAARTGGTRSGSGSLTATVKQANQTISTLRNDLNTLANQQTGQTKQTLLGLNDQLGRLTTDLEKLSGAQPGDRDKLRATSGQLLKDLEQTLQGLGETAGPLLQSLLGLLPELTQDLADILGGGGNGLGGLGQLPVSPGGSGGSGGPGGSGASGQVAGQQAATAQENAARPGPMPQPNPVPPPRQGAAPAQPRDNGAKKEKMPEPMTLAQWLGPNGQLGMLLDAQRGGVQVSAVSPGSFAAESGLRRGDEIRAVNGTKVTTPEQFLSQLGPAAQANGLAEVAISRNGEVRTFQLDMLGLRTGIRLAEAADPPPKASKEAAPSGIALDSVRKGSLGADAGLQPGDKILTLNGRPVSSVANLRSGLTTAIREESEVFLKVSRGEMTEDVRFDFRMR